jgi:predicted chitinase
MHERIVPFDGQPRKKLLRERMAKGIATGIIAFGSLGAAGSASAEYHPPASSPIQLFEPSLVDCAKDILQKEKQMINNLTAHAKEYSDKFAYKHIPTPEKEIQENITILVDALKEGKIATPRVIAYAMATMAHETWYTFKPIKENNGPAHAIQYGYSGGENYYGRGYIQLTHDFNYRIYGEKIGMGDKLVKDPDLALDPDIAARLFVAYFKRNNVDDLAEKNFVSARRPVASTAAYSIAQQAQEYLQVIPKNAFCA